MSETLVLPEGVTTNQISDGYHTFGELYEHRCNLFLALMKALKDDSWFSLKHDDTSSFEGWFICGIQLETGMVTYHLPIDLWDVARRTGALELELAPTWDGHTADDVVVRLQESI